MFNYPELTSYIGAKTDFSLGESILGVKRAVQEMAGMDIKSMTITDVNTVNALPKAYRQAKEDNIKLNFGAQIKVVDDLAWRRPKRNEPKSSNPFFMPRLIAKNDTGMREIMNLLTLANDEDHFYEAAQVSLDELISVAQNGNIVVTTGDTASLFALSTFQDRMKRLVSSVERSNFFVELIPVRTAYYDRINEISLKIANSLAIPPILTRPALYENKQRAEARNVMNCTLNRSTVESRRRNEPATDSMYVMLPEEIKVECAELTERMVKRGLDRNIPEHFITKAVQNANAIGDSLSYTWEKYDVCLPQMHEQPFNRLVEIVMQGWKKRIEKEVFGYKPSTDKLVEYKARLKYELGVLKNMGFENYFLLVHQVVDQARTMDIIVGPGRGSIGGSLVAYLMGLHDVDPIRFGLIFERFINPERLDLPDADLDFMSSRREDIIQWLIEKYGQDYVCGISNYGVLGAPSALRRAGAAHNLTEIDYACSKQIPKEHGSSKSLEEAAEEVPNIKAFSTTYPTVWRDACSLQGIFNIYGQHAAGVVVAGEKISERAVVEVRKGGHLCNWDKSVVEDFGLVKLDILGLSNLDVLRLAKDYIQERHGVKINYEDVPLDDPDVLDAFGKGETNAVFQFESGGMKGLLKNLAKYERLSFEDIAAATALYRPGPIDAGLLDQFINVKQGDAVEEYPHPSCENALKETKGVIVYQESVMRIAQDLSGFTMAEADILRKAIGKKDARLMATMSDKFVEGAIASGMVERDARALWSDIEGFAAYSFNKSHAVAYTLISYLTMWLKVKYPSEFFAASMSVLKEEKLPGLVRDATLNGLIISPPDINVSTDRFEIQYDTKRGRDALYIPFQRLKGLSSKSSEAIMKARQKRLSEKGSPVFDSKEDFLSYVDKRRCNVRVQASLDSVGSFCSVEPDQIDPLHPDRLKDQKQLLPGLIASDIKADRKVDMSPFVRKSLNEVLRRALHVCPTYKGEPVVMPSAPKKTLPRMMVITDHPNYSEKSEEIMMAGKASGTVRAAMKEAEVTPGQCYFTALSKMGKPDGIKQLPQQMLIDFGPILDEEIALLKPPVIVALGTAVARHLIPDLKGGWEEIAGTTHYDAKRDCTIVIGCNPAMVYFDADRISHIVEAFDIARGLTE